MQPRRYSNIDVININISFFCKGLRLGIFSNVLVNFAKLNQIRNKGTQNKLM